MNQKIFKSIWAIIAGFLTIFILSTAVDLILHQTGIYPPMGVIMSDELFALATAYRVFFGILSGYVTAKIAPDQPVKHSLALGVLGLIVSITGAIVMWDAGPAWYSLAIIAIALPCSWAGGILYERSQT
ncbi:hypothetical protein RBB68_04770 [Leptospira interrogans]|uniref:Uncharacterized protein n=11 Tax=Leptospira interrogans TaxID=173 RepID=Q8F1F9_LEPIN|nr:MULTISPECIES: hypothetical protein [Leptospira]EMG09270.1 hypothetical protein LEP1GSC151_0724 [Leptospira interrogans serovar Grippotyphosa str. LT2186]EMG19232.1 hypothetical protein LEP1GSC150_2882 [Leptospira interrogans serovar Copenhageni str. LT2050]EMM80845.1 hypothetical protein LEP1GSC037_0262 [Leptospira interrogans str. 2006001854]EMN72157.1 hypothetical protein LEP1GSC100_0774 [Leptospira interrogans serovar Bataviae str. UI 08561]AAN50375.1 hypothetical protein LA_3176 [Leptos